MPMVNGDSGKHIASFDSGHRSYVLPDTFCTRLQGSDVNEFDDFR